MQSYGPVITGRKAALHVLGDDVKGRQRYTVGSVTRVARTACAVKRWYLSRMFRASQNSKNQGTLTAGTHRTCSSEGGARRRTVLEGVALAGEVVPCNDMAEVVVVQG